MGLRLRVLWTVATESESSAFGWWFTVTEKISSLGI